MFRFCVLRRPIKKSSRFRFFAISIGTKKNRRLLCLWRYEKIDREWNDNLRQPYVELRVEERCGDSLQLALLNGPIFFSFIIFFQLVQGLHPREKKIFFFSFFLLLQYKLILIRINKLIARICSSTNHAFIRKKTQILIFYSL